MSHHWNALLNNAQFASGTLAQGVIALGEHVIITATGAQAVAFLQGQCTCDFKRLANNEWLLGAHCNAKGRMQSSFIAVQLAPDCVALRIHHSIAEQALILLQKYAALSRVKCEISTFIAAALVNLDENTKHFLAMPALDEHQCALKLENEQPRIWLQHSAQLTEVWFKSDDPIWTQLKQQPLWRANEWQRLMIEQGVAEVQQATIDLHIPQEFNYDLIDGISFKKGCYTGQEIIARVHYKGQSKKRLHRLSIKALDARAPMIGDAVINADGKVLGNVTAVAAIADGYELLACSSGFSITAETGERLYLEGQMERPLQPLPLPYAIP